MRISTKFNGDHKPATAKDKQFEVPRWKSQVIGGRSRRPRKVTLPKIEMREVKA